MQQSCKILGPRKATLLGAPIMWLTDKEQLALLGEDPGPLTDKIRREVALAVRQVAERQKQIESKVDEHDSFIVGLGQKFSAAFGMITSYTGKATGKRS